MGKIADLLLWRSWRAGGGEELSDAAMVQMIRAAGTELTELRALVQRIAGVVREPEQPGDVERKLRTISALLRRHGR